jgi:hypothetical protein
MEEALKGSMVGFSTGQIVTGKIIEVRAKEVLVDSGYKSEGTVNGGEFEDIKTVKVGDAVEVLIEKLEDKDGMVVLSKEKAEFKKNWDRILLIAGEGGFFTLPDGRRGAMLRAYDKATGQDAGEVYMPAPQTGSPMTYMLNGKQYIVLAIGGGTYSAELVAFALPDDGPKR